MAQQTQNLQLPCVLPQISHSLFGGKYDSPFLRAYPPSLNLHGIPESTFLSFIDALNSFYIRNPALETATNMGSAVSAFGGPHGALIGKALKMASKTASGAMSSSRSKAFLTEINESVFGPNGFSVEILPTYMMLQVIGCPADRFTAGRASTGSTDVDEVARDEPMESRMAALRGYVGELEYHVVAQTESDGAVKRMGEKQAAKKAEKQSQKKKEDMEKAREKRDEERSKAREKYEEEVLKLKEDLRDELKKEEGSPEKQEEARRKFEEEMEKLERNEGRKMRGDVEDSDDEVKKLEKKEAEEAGKLFWVVVTPLGWAAKARKDHRVELSSKAGEKAKKHFIESLLG